MTRPDRVRRSSDSGFVLGGRYRLAERIATGGMGTVWEATDETLHRSVAVKLLNEGLAADEVFTERFRREARHAAALSHPNIAGVFDYGEDDGRPYIVMELIDGEDLAQLLHRAGRLDPDEVSRIGADVATALAHAHAAGIVHRDVKPANVMLTRNGHVKVTDFGIAAPLEGSTGLTATGSVMGTSRYIAPEQAAGERATPASDVYSLGVVLYEALAGEPMFVRDSPVATALAHMHDEPRPVREARPETPSALAGAVHSALAKDPAERPTAAALASDLQARGGMAPVVPDEEADTAALPLGTAGAATPEPTSVLPAEPTEPEPRATKVAASAPARPPSPERDRRKTAAAVVAGALLALLLIGELTAGGYSPVRAPHLVGLTRGAAMVRAQRFGLNPTTRPVAGDAAAGTVVGQRPRAGRMVATGTQILLLVSTGPQQPVIVPPPTGGKQGPGPSHGHGHDKHKGHD